MRQEQTAIRQPTCGDLSFLPDWHGFWVSSYRAVSAAATAIVVYSLNETEIVIKKRLRLLGRLGNATSRETKTRSMPETACDLEISRIENGRKSRYWRIPVAIHRSPLIRTRLAKLSENEQTSR